MDDRASKIAPKIAVVQGAPSAEVQELFRSLAGRWRPSSRLAGVLAEDHGLPDGACSAGYLRSLVDGVRYAIFQDLGPAPRAATCRATARSRLPLPCAATSRRAATS